MTIKLSKDLSNKLSQAAAAAGYSSAEEFVLHVLERESARISAAASEDDEEIARRLKGLGYID